MDGRPTSPCAADAGSLSTLMARKTTPKPPPPPPCCSCATARPPRPAPTLPGRARGLHLADKGHDQAEAAADRIAALEKVTAVYASPLERTRETAAPIAKALGLRVAAEQGPARVRLRRVDRRRR